MKNKTVVRSMDILNLFIDHAAFNVSRNYRTVKYPENFSISNANLFRGNGFC